jgi:hypothetical protein
MDGHGNQPALHKPSTVLKEVATEPEGSWKTGWYTYQPAGTTKIDTKPLFIAVSHQTQKSMQTDRIKQTTKSETPVIFPEELADCFARIDTYNPGMCYLYPCKP